MSGCSDSNCSFFILFCDFSLIFFFFKLCSSSARIICNSSFTEKLYRKYMTIFLKTYRYFVVLLAHDACFETMYCSVIFKYFIFSGTFVKCTFLLWLWNMNCFFLSRKMFSFSIISNLSHFSANSISLVWNRSYVLAKRNISLCSFNLCVKPQLFFAKKMRFHLSKQLNYSQFGVCCVGFFFCPHLL